MAQPPKSYDDIVRDTVLDPDGSKRPSVAQEAEGRARTGPGYPDEDALRVAVLERLRAEHLDVTVEVERGRVTLHGHVSDQAAISRVQAVVEAVSGVVEVENRLVTS
ncbi:MAG: BON domain-containing protein [Kofleriaceae bacterium]